MREGKGGRKKREIVGREPQSSVLHQRSARFRLDGREERRSRGARSPPTLLGKGRLPGRKEGGKEPPHFPHVRKI